MTHLLNCPVCGYKEIEGNTCPNCDTDLSLIRSLTELPALDKAEGAEEAEGAEGVRSRSKVAIWQVGVALLILIFGIGLGTLGSFLFLQPQLVSNKITTPPVAIKGDKIPNPPTEFPPLQTSPYRVGTESNVPPSRGDSRGVERGVSPLTRQYTVKPGDNLTLIAEKFCGKGNSWQVMVKANPQLQSHPNLIDVGEVLKQPNCEG